MERERISTFISTTGTTCAPRKWFFFPRQTDPNPDPDSMSLTRAFLLPTLAISNGEGCNNIIKSSRCCGIHVDAALLLSLDVTFVLLVLFRPAVRRIVTACPHLLLARIVVL